MPINTYTPRYPSRMWSIRAYCLPAALASVLHATLFLSIRKITATNDPFRIMGNHVLSGNGVGFLTF